MIFFLPIAVLCTWLEHRLRRLVDHVGDVIPSSGWIVSCYDPAIRGRTVARRNQRWFGRVPSAERLLAEREFALVEETVAEFNESMHRYKGIPS